MQKNIDKSIYQSRNNNLYIIDHLQAAPSTTYHLMSEASMVGGRGVNCKVGEYLLKPPAFSTESPVGILKNYDAVWKIELGVVWCFSIIPVGINFADGIGNLEKLFIRSNRKGNFIGIPGGIN